ncbi:MAG: M48 family metalloprotease, partial [Phaeodactylibacter sp.]|nr:M48 family metalloprotease [Phaeodactylibacter sp.]
NAAASNLTRPVVIASEPLLEALTDEEEYAVLAHEFAHIKCGHQKHALTLKFLSLAAQTSNKVAMTFEYIDSGWRGMAAGAITNAGMFAKTGWDLFKTVKDIRSTKEDDKKDEMSPEDLKRIKRVVRNNNLVRYAVSVGSISIFNPKFAAVWAAAKTLNEGCKLTEASLSRRMEYQADRGAVELGASPLALITALRKVEMMVANAAKKELGEAPQKSQKGFLSRKWSEFHRTHPLTKDRIEKLAKFARKSGAYSEDEIQTAIHGELDLDAAQEINLAMAQTMANQFVPDRQVA